MAATGVARLAVGKEACVDHTTQLLIAVHLLFHQAGQARGRAHVRRKKASQIIAVEL
jgi:hypothetical protein